MPWKIIDVTRVRDTAFPLTRAAITVRYALFDANGNMMAQAVGTRDRLDWNESNPIAESIARTAGDRLRLLNQMDIAFATPIDATVVSAVISPPPPVVDPAVEAANAKRAAIQADLQRRAAHLRAIAQGLASAADADIAAVKTRLDAVMAGADRDIALSLM